jgi:hypothetical protein
MQRGTLNLNSRYNVFLGTNTYIVRFSYQKKAYDLLPSIADSHIHFSFDKGEFLFLLEDHIVEAFYKTLDNAHRVKRENFPTLPVCVQCHELMLSLYLNW